MNIECDSAKSVSTIRSLSILKSNNAMSPLVFCFTEVAQNQISGPEISGPIGGNFNCCFAVREERRITIEGAMIVVTLDDTKPVTREDISWSTWVGDGRNRWYDKHQRKFSPTLSKPSF